MQFRAPLYLQLGKISLMSIRHAARSGLCKVCLSLQSEKRSFAGLRRQMPSGFEDRKNRRIPSLSLSSGEGCSLR